MPPSPQDPSLEHIAEEIYAPFLVGVFFSTLLYGINVVQVFTYYGHSSKKDSSWLRGLVFFLFICVTASTALNMVAVYLPLIRKFGQVDRVLPLYLRTEPMMTSIVSMPVQLLMAWRIMIVTQTRVWTCIIVVISLVSFGTSISTTVYLELRPAFSQFPSFRASPVTWLVSSAVADVLITGVLVYSLHEKKSGFNTSLDLYVNHIIRLTIQTGALTALFTLSDALVFIAVKDTTIFFAWGLSLSKLYLSTILSSLNARDTWRDGANALYPSDLNELPGSHGPIRFRATSPKF
ncbi:hypothetical protein C8J56DRAFT_1048317 [Mycena floridula]|nr:hypothetical protein C8J56DRAFT_1048317 [Mycena floridula]